MCEAMEAAARLFMAGQAEEEEEEVASDKQQPSSDKQQPHTVIEELVS